MVNMLRFELRKLLKKPSFYICAVLCLLFVVMSVSDAKSSFDMSLENYQTYYSGFYDDDGQRFQRIQEQFANSFSPEMLAFQGFASMMFPVGLAIFSAIYICEDKFRGTIKNIYARGYSRTDIFFAKFIVTTGIAMIAFLLVTLAYYLSGMLIFATSNTVGAEMVHVEGFILLLAGELMAILMINAMYFMLSELIGSIGFSIAANLFVPFLIRCILFVIGNLCISMLYHENISSFEAYSLIMKIAEYWVFDLAYNGFSVGMETSDYIGHLIACVGYFAIFGALGWLIIRKRQVKN